MILPKKQLSICESFFGFGAFLLEYMEFPVSVDELWNYYKISCDNKKYPVKFSFDQFIITLDYLFIIDAIRENERGLLCRETNQANS